MKRAVLYLRVSKREQVEGHSLDAQARLCTDWCARRGFDIVETFREEGESAKTTERTQLREMLGYLRRHSSIDAVVVKDFSRFARSAHDHHVVRALLLRHGVTLHSVLEPVDDSPFGRFVETIFAGTHQLENELRGERTRTCMDQAMREGRWLFHVPLGYRWVRSEDGAKSIQVDAERAELVRRGFELVASGECGPAEALKRVTAAGLRTRSGKRLTMQTWCGSILRHPLYTGRVIYPPWGIDAEGDHETIVPRDTWQRVQAALAGKAPEPATRGKRLDHPDFPLRRFTRCGRCDTPLTGEWATGRNRRYAYYRCRERTCRAVKISKADLETAFTEWLAELQPSRAYMVLLREVVLDVWHGDRATAREEAKRLERKVTELRDRKDRLVEAGLFEQAIDRETYDRLHHQISADLGDLELELANARTEDLDVDGLLDYALDVLTHADRLWAQLEPEMQRRFERSLFPDGVAYDPGSGFRTATTSLLFEPLERESLTRSGMVARTGFEPVLPA